MHDPFVTLSLTLTVIVLSCVDSSFSSHTGHRDELNFIKTRGEPSENTGFDTIRYKYPHRYSHRQLKPHPKHVDSLRIFRQQFQETPSDLNERSRRSHLQYTAQLVSFNVTPPLDLTDTPVPTRNRFPPRSRSQDDHSVRAADQNFAAFQNFTCYNPRPRLVYLDQVGKTYWPRGTILHRCADDTGCCAQAYTCSPKSKVEVTAYFFVNSSASNWRMDIEALTFFNHTECECREINPHPRLTVSQESWPLKSSSIEQPISPDSPLIKSSTSQLLPDRPDKSAKSKEYEASVREAQCARTSRCPAPFKAIPESTSPLRCTCDCESPSDKLCIDIKQGRERLPDFRCVLAVRCTPPRCEYGTYEKSQGRCPRESEKSHAAFYPNSPNERE